MNQPIQIPSPEQLGRHLLPMETKRFEKRTLAERLVLAATQSVFDKHLQAIRAEQAVSSSAVGQTVAVEQTPDVSNVHTFPVPEQSQAPELEARNGEVVDMEAYRMAEQARRTIEEMPNAA